MKSPVNVAPLSSSGMRTTLKLSLRETKMSPVLRRFLSVRSSFLMCSSSTSSRRSFPSAVTALWRMTLTGSVPSFK